MMHTQTTTATAFLELPPTYDIRTLMLTVELLLIVLKLIGVAHIWLVDS